jgi:hypothetical protein
MVLGEKLQLLCNAAMTFVNGQNKGLRLFAALLVCALLTACAPSMTQRIKVTVTVDDNGTLHTGSAVQQWTCTETNNALGGMAIGGCYLKAEAIPIKIGNKGWVFMIFTGSPGDGFDPGYYTGAIQQGRSKDFPEKPWLVPFDKAPAFVRFADIKDRRTVQLVEPSAFGTAFGEGVSLLSIQVEPSTERLTRGKTQAILPWLKELDDDYFDETIPDYQEAITRQGIDLLREISGTNFNWGLR